MEEDGSEALAAPVRLFTPIFSQEQEIILLEEYKNFVERNGHNIRNKWVEFRKMCSLDGKYKHKQIAKKIAGLENKFHKQKMNSSSLPPHPHQLRLFQLSESLWGDADPPKPKPKPKKRSLSLIIDQPSNKKPSKIEWADLEVEELELYCKRLALQQRQCQMVLQELKREDNFNTQSSSSKKKQSEEKDTTDTEEDPASQEYLEQERDESEEVNLEKIEPPVDGGILSKEVINFVEDEELQNEAVDLSIDCVEEKIENQLLDFANSGGMEIVLPQQVHVKVGDDGTKKTSSKKKKKKKKKKKDSKGTSPQAPQDKTEPFGLNIEVLEEGDPNGKFVYKGAKVKIHIYAKVKGSEQPFESSIGIVNLGDEGMIEGLRTGIEGMLVGGKRRLFIPPSLGYGDEGCESATPPIPPNSWLEYEVQLLDVAVRRSD